MKALFQWAVANPGQSLELDVSDWVSLPNRGPPLPGAQADGNPGWINSLNIMGARFYADRYAVEALNDGEGGTRVWMQNDGGNPTSPHRYMRIVDFWPLAPDAALGGAYNTRWQHTIYSDEAVLSAPQYNTTILPWSQRTPPDAALWRYGKNLPDYLYNAHLAAETRRGWREWTDGVPQDQISTDGRVKDQRTQGRYNVPDGTITYYHNAIAEGSATHNAPTPNSEHQLALAPSGGPVISNSGAINAVGQTPWVCTTLAGQPGQAPWPDGNYRRQLDVVTANTDLTFGLLIQGNGDGHFARVDAGALLEVDLNFQVEAAFTLTGLFLATTGVIGWAGATATDRFETAIAAIRIIGHGNADMDLELGEADDFVDGPWVPAVGGRRIFIT